jgi:fructokinase
MTDGRRIAGVELGGTKCIVVLATAEGEILEQASVLTEAPDVTIAGITASLDRWWADGGFAALGIASFGPLQLNPRQADYGWITATAKPGWRDTHVLTPLAADYGVPVAFDTDVNGAAMAEGRWGAAKGLDDYAYVTIGTGVGVGLIVNGRPTRGLGHCEAGHMLVARLPSDDWPGQCPYHGACVEGLASGPAIAARLGVPGVQVAGDHPVWDGVVEALAQMAQALICTSGPRRLLFGGGVVAARPELIDLIEARVRVLIGGYLALPDDALITPPGLGINAGPLGPIALALARYER